MMRSESNAGIVTDSVTLDVEGTYNFRSTGGFSADHGVTRADGLYRSDALHRLGAAGSAQFQLLGISRIIDLRYAAEVAQKPNALPQGSVEIVQHPIFDAAALASLSAARSDAALPTPSLTELTVMMVRERAEALTEAVRLIADAPEGGVLVHCTAGKDRTGMVIATALSAIGVQRAQVVSDYAATAGHLAGEWSRQRVAAYEDQLGAPVPEALIEIVTTSPPEVMIAALDAVDELYGGVELMLRAHGLDDSALERLHARLVT